MRFRPPITRAQFSQWLPIVLIVIGLLCCSYVAANYLWIIGKQHQLAREWQAHPQTPKVSPGGVFARLLIPRIGLDAMVVEGATRRDLLLGPAHLDNTALPGSPGNAVIAAHRDTFFRGLDQLTRGDSIYVQGGDRKYHYAVTQTKVVDPSDTAVLSASHHARLTLITCYPMHYIGPAPKRLVVIADLQRESPRPVTSALVAGQN